MPVDTISVRPSSEKTIHETVIETVRVKGTDPSLELHEGTDRARHNLSSVSLFAMQTNIADAGWVTHLSVDANGVVDLYGDIELIGTVLIDHTALEDDDHALEIDVDAAGYGDVEAIDIVYTTGDIATAEEEAVLLINIDETAATGGDISGLEMIATEGSADKLTGLFVGVGIGPVEQLSGSFGDADNVDVDGVDQTTALSTGGAGNITLFVADDDYLIVGNAAKFQEIEAILDTGASGSGITPTYEYSTGVGTWGSFVPIDGTNQFRNTGVIIWLDSDIPSWAPGTGSEYLIRITRTKNSLTTTPIADLVKIAATTTEYYWDKDGRTRFQDTTLNTLSADPSAPETGTVTLWVSDGSGSGSAGDVLSIDSSSTVVNLSTGGGGGGGDFVGPGSATDNAVVRHSGTTGKLGQNSVVIIDDLGEVTGVLTLDVGTSPTSLDTVNVDGAILLKHTSTQSDDHALEIDVDAAGYGDVEAIDIAYTTGAIAGGTEEAVLLINIDETAATGGDIFGLEMIATEGSADEMDGLFVGAGVGAIEQLSGTFADADTVDVDGVDETTDLSTGGAGGVSIFVADDDYLIVGAAATFEEIEAILDTGASGSGITPTFEFSTGVGTWSSFSPIDGTNQFRNTGVIVWLDSDIPSWAPGTGSEYLIRITRTKNSLTTTPIADLVKIAATTEYKWDKNGDVSINELTLNGGYLIFKDQASDAGSPGAGNHEVWVSDGTGSGFDGDLMLKTDTNKVWNLLKHGSGTASFLGMDGGAYANTSTAIYSVVVGGRENDALAEASFVGGGRLNVANTANSVVVGGQSNVISTNIRAFIGGGFGNTCDAQDGVLVGGETNTVGIGAGCFIGGGKNNSTGTLGYSVVVGGNNNDLTGQYCFMGGGLSNQMTATSYATLVGGTACSVATDYSFVGGGNANTITAGNSSVIVGGSTNTSSGANTFIGGGLSNDATSDYDVICGGDNGNINGTYGFIGTGHDNTINSTSTYNTIVNGNSCTIDSNAYNFIGSGFNLHITATNSYNCIVSGETNTISGTQEHGFIGGGTLNEIATGRAGVICGGNNNDLSTGSYIFMGGGANNDASGTYSVCCGGDNNSVTGGDSVICGGEDNVVSTTNSFIGGGFNNEVNTDNYGTIVGGNGNTVSALYGFIGAGAINSVTGDYSVIAGGDTNSITSAYSFIGSGDLNVVGGSRGFIGAGIRNSMVAGSDDSVICGGEDNTITTNPSDQCFIGGGTTNSITAGLYNVIVGGNGNLSDNGSGCFIGGGYTNNTSSNWSCVLGGQNNDATSNHASVGGGELNVASGDGSHIGGGHSNLASATDSTVGGGLSNQATDLYTVVCGGSTNVASTDHASICGGEGNTATGDGSHVGGGHTNAVKGVDSFIGAGLTNTMAGGNNYSVIAGGELNNIGLLGLYVTIGGGNNNSTSASADYVTIAGGRDNVGGTTSSHFYATVGGGYNNSVEARSATIPGGEDNTAGGDYSMVSGYGGISTQKSELVMGRTPRAANGDCQTRILTLGITTTSATSANLSDDGATDTGGSIYVPLNTTMSVKGHVIARKSDGTVSARWSVDALAHRGASGNAIIDGQTVTEDFGLTSGYSVAFTAGSGGFKLTATGAASTTLYWGSTLSIIEVA